MFLHIDSAEFIGGFECSVLGVDRPAPGDALGSGDMAASIISGFAMSYIVALVGTINLLLIAVVGVAGSLLLLVYTIHICKEQLEDS